MPLPRRRRDYPQSNPANVFDACLNIMENKLTRIPASIITAAREIQMLKATREEMRDISE
jgi:hypothetical protein